MIVCLCDAASDRRVSLAIDAGARSIEDLQRHRIGTGCGSCHPTLREMIRAANHRDTPPLAADHRTPLPVSDHAAA
jgi:bacterioferritin-associated ferredoxin